MYLSFCHCKCKGDIAFLPFNQVQILPPLSIRLQDKLPLFLTNTLPQVLLPNTHTILSEGHGTLEGFCLKAVTHKAILPYLWDGLIDEYLQYFNKLPKWREKNTCFQEKLYLKQCHWNNSRKMTSLVCSSQQFGGGVGVEEVQSLSGEKSFVWSYMFSLSGKVQSIPNAYWMTWCDFSFVWEPFVHCQLQMQCTATFRGKVIKLLFCRLSMLFCSASEKESIALCWIGKRPLAGIQTASDVYSLPCKTSEVFNN